MNHLMMNVANFVSFNANANANVTAHIRAQLRMLLMNLKDSDVHGYSLFLYTILLFAPRSRISLCWKLFLMTMVYTEDATLLTLSLFAHILFKKTQHIHTILYKTAPSYTGPMTRSKTRTLLNGSCL